ncbi:MAG TPA: hypothetical protein VIE37_02130 [Methylomirabilota bacterium]|jgi:hypothetical protein
MSVYYLPTRTLTDSDPSTTEWPSLPERLRNAWWRLRLAIVEMRAILRSQPRSTGPSTQYDLFSEVPPPPRPSRPARVIDFEEARQRLRPAGPQA